jgi:hypothetical protein
MDSIWLDAGLDLRMRTFSVLPTDRNKGFIELVPAAVTLREIQAGAGNGISGSLKERPLQTWLLRQRMDWHQVRVENAIFFRFENMFFKGIYKPFMIFYFVQLLDLQ